MQFNKEEYDRYINSRQWKNKRAIALERAQYKCQRCGFSKWTRKLEVHHKTYERFGNELQEDLEVLCEECHIEADKERAERGKQKSEHARNKAFWNARLDGWATKIYGDFWEDNYHVEDIEAEFYDWLERQD